MLESGSRWRRWDLHIHTPDTALNDQFGEWEEYLTVIEGQTEVRVMGVTDYLSITNYSKLRAYKDAGRIPDINLLIPNIEFRIAPPSNKATAVNIHLLVSPDDPYHEVEINNALGRLTWTFNNRNYSCLPDQLSALGRAVDASASDDKLALEIGVTHYKPDFSALRDWLKKEPWLQKNSIVVVSAGNDGLSGFTTDDAWGGYRQEITRFSRMLFSGRPGERDFWLGERSPDDLEQIRRLGGFKPCIHGSDAHDIAHLFKPDQDRFCWIKADTTFEGLRQLLYEPGDRVFIGPTPPVMHDEARVIRAIKLSNSNGWFNDVEIPFNPGLVSVIGQKGSGKSALAELTACAAGSWVTTESGSFLRRAGALLRDMNIELEWGNGETISVRVGNDLTDYGHVRYLSQKFVERLCSDDHIGEELVREIEGVVFSYLDPSDTLNASSFDELRALRTQGIRAEGNRLSYEIKRLTDEECALRDNAAKLTEKRVRITALIEEKKGLVKQLPKPASEQEAEHQADLNAKRSALAIAQQDVGTDKQKLQKIKDVRAKVTAFKAELRRFATDIDVLLTETGVPRAERAPFHPTFPGDTEPPLTRRETEINASIAARLGTVENHAENTIRWLQKQIAALEKQATADKARQERIKTIQARLAAIDTELNRINNEVAQIEGPKKERIKVIRGERMAAYVAYFENLKTEQQTLETLYAPVSGHLASEAATAQEQDLEFSIRWLADVKKWIERGSVLFDQRRAIPYSTIEGIEEAANRILAPAWISGDATKISPAMEEFLEPFRDRELPPNKYLRAGITLQDVFDWLYEVEHVRLSYGLKYNGTDLEKLSPGTKGIVLLILYLGMDVADTRPLIVDQLSSVI